MYLECIERLLFLWFFLVLPTPLSADWPLLLEPLASNAHSTADCLPVRASSGDEREAVIVNDGLSFLVVPVTRDARRVNVGLLRPLFYFSFD